MTDEQLLLDRMMHRLRTSLAVISGYSELGMTRDDAELKAEARVAVATAVADLSNGIDEVMLALELSWHPGAGTLGSVDVRQAVADAVARTARVEATVEPGAEVTALADHETVVRALQALLRAAGPGPCRVTLGVVGSRARVAIESSRPIAVDDERLALKNAHRLAELLDGAVSVDDARLELELPAG